MLRESNTDYLAPAAKDDEVAQNEEKLVSDGSDSLTDNPLPVFDKTKRNFGAKRFGKGQYFAGNNRFGLPIHYPMFPRNGYMPNFYPPSMSGTRSRINNRLPPPYLQVPLMTYGDHYNGYRHPQVYGSPPALAAPMFVNPRSNIHRNDRGKDGGHGDTVQWDSSEDDMARSMSDQDLAPQHPTRGTKIVLEKKWEVDDTKSAPSKSLKLISSDDELEQAVGNLKRCKILERMTQSENDIVESAPNSSYQIYKGLRFMESNSAIPLIYVSSSGTISVMLENDIVIELSVDRSVRIVRHDQFAVFVNSRGTSASIVHEKAKMLHTKENVYSKFKSSNEKMAVFGPQGVLFTMSHLGEAYFVSSFIKGASAVALDQLSFPPMNNDYTMKLFFAEAQSGDQFINLCQEIVAEATYYRKMDGTLIMHINGLTVRQKPNGDVYVDCRPRHISCSPTTGSVRVRSSFVDMGLQENDKAFIKRGMKRVHVSNSGMVVSDGNCIASMDHLGRIVSCT